MKCHPITFINSMIKMYSRFLTKRSIQKSCTIFKIGQRSTNKFLKTFWANSRNKLKRKKPKRKRNVFSRHNQRANLYLNL